MQFIEDNHPHQDSSSSAASASSASAGVSDSPSPIAPTTVNRPRRRGRPPGSKNKPKPKINPNSSPTPPRIPSPSSLRALLLQVDHNHDVVESLTNFCRTRSISLSVLSASGSLSHFVLRHPSPPSPNLIFRGRFEIIFISATVIDSGPTPSPTPSSPFPSTFTVTVRGSDGEVIGGVVNGPLVAAGQVFIVAASSSDKPTYHRLPEMEVEGNGNSNTRVVEGNKRRQIGPEGGGCTFGA